MVSDQLSQQINMIQAFELHELFQLLQRLTNKRNINKTPGSGTNKKPKTDGSTKSSDVKALTTMSSPEAFAALSLNA